MQVLSWLFSRSKKKVEREKFKVENETSSKIRKINNLRQVLTSVEQNQRKLQLKFERDLREYDRRKRALEKRREFCSNEIEAEQYGKEIEGYERLINEIKERLRAITTRTAKIKQIIIMLELLEMDQRAVIETNLPNIIDEFLDVFVDEGTKDFNRDLDYQLNRLYEELDMILRNVKEREYDIWLDMSVDSEKEREKERVPE